MSTQRIPVCRKCGSLEVVEEESRAIEAPQDGYDGGDPAQPHAPHVTYSCTGCGERFIGVAVRAEA